MLSLLRLLSVFFSSSASLSSGAYSSSVTKCLCWAPCALAFWVGHIRASMLRNLGWSISKFSRTVFAPTPPGQFKQTFECKKRCPHTPWCKSKIALYFRVGIAARTHRNTCALGKKKERNDGMHTLGYFQMQLTQG